MGAPRTIYIAGAGIGGLTLALGLAKFGLSVTVLERNADLSEFGAGLQISPNARKVLDSLGLGEAIAERSFQPAGIDIFPDGRAHPLQTLMLGEEIATRFGAPYSVMHRADLVDVLHTAAKRFANIDIVFGVSDFSVETEGKTVTVTANEPDGKTRRAQPFAFVGADGVRSATRMQVFGGPEAHYTGKVAWRALVPPHQLSEILNFNRTSLLLGARFHLVIYPLPYRNAVNLALFTQEAQANLAVLNDRSPQISTGGNRRLRAILDAVGDNWTPWVMSTVEMARWHKGAVGLLGDAAHAMLPFQAQGAAMAIEDAAVLAPLLSAAPDAAHAFARYEVHRQERVRRVQQISRANGKAFHMSPPLSLARDIVIRLQGPRGHFKRLDWLYGNETNSAD